MNELMIMTWKMTLINGYGICIYIWQPPVPHRPHCLLRFFSYGWPPQTTSFKIWNSEFLKMPKPQRANLNEAGNGIFSHIGIWLYCRDDEIPEIKDHMFNKWACSSRQRAVGGRNDGVLILASSHLRRPSNMTVGHSHLHDGDLRGREYWEKERAS